MIIPINARVGLLLLVLALPGCGGQPQADNRSNTETTQEPPSAQALPTPAVVETTGPGEVFGFVFEDKNRNGVFDAGDQRMAQQTVTLSDPSRRRQIRSATTGTDGAFRFDRLAAGPYRVEVDIPQGFERTNDDSFVLTVSADGKAPEAQFGIAR